MSAKWFFRFFCGLFFLGGTFFAIVLPTFQVPDEVAHYTRAFELSRGSCSPTDFIVMPSGYRADYTIFHPWLERDELVKSGGLYEAETSHFKLFDRQPPEKFAPIHAEDVYACPLYVPAAVALALIRPLHPSIVASVVLARLFTFLTCGSLIVVGLRLMPFAKELYAFIALLPMQLQQLAAVSPDAVVNSIAFITIAFVLRRIVRNRNRILTRGDIFTLLALSVIIGFAKIDILILFLLLLLPEAKFLNQSSRVLLIIGCFAIAGTIVALSPKLSTLSSQAFVAYRQSQDIRVASNFRFILDHPAAMLGDLILTLRIVGGHLLAETIGTFGWLSFELPPPFIDLASIVLVVLGYRAAVPGVFAAAIKRFSLLLTGVAFFAVYLSLFVTNEAYHDLGTLINGDGYIGGVQGRYFLSFLIFPAVAISGGRVRTKSFDRFLSLFAGAALLLGSVYTVVSSYYMVD